MNSVCLKNMFERITYKGDQVDTSTKVGKKEH